MAQKGVNTIINEVRGSFTKTINEGLQQLPVGIIKLILENTMSEIDTYHSSELNREKQEYEQTVQAESEQVEYVPEEAHETVEAEMVE